MILLSWLLCLIVSLGISGPIRQRITHFYLFCKNMDDDAVDKKYIYYNREHQFSLIQ